MDLSRSGRGFCEELAAYEEWLRSIYREADFAWRRVSVVERRHDLKSNGRETQDLRGFETRFAAILQSTTHGWVNLSAVTIRGDMLVVAVEWAGDDDGGRSSGQQVSVNWSGFQQREVERLTGR